MNGAAFEPDLALWDAWPPAEVAERLAGVGAPWCVAAGWAIDLFLGEQRRPHDDLEIAVPRHSFPQVSAALASYELFVPAGDGLLRPYADDAESHQTWVREPVTGLWRLDVFREPAEGDTWICRRDPSIRLLYAELVERTRDGIPYCRPEIVLLFKAKHVRPKDEDDLAAVLPRLTRPRRDLLAGLLARVHPGHAWLGRLA